MRAAVIFICFRCTLYNRSLAEAAGEVQPTREPCVSCLLQERECVLVMTAKPIEVLETNTEDR